MGVISRLQMRPLHLVGAVASGETLKDDVLYPLDPPVLNGELTGGRHRQSTTPLHPDQLQRDRCCGYPSYWLQLARPLCPHFAHNQVART